MAASRNTMFSFVNSRATCSAEKHIYKGCFEWVWNFVGFISINCGIAPGSDYTDDETQIYYTLDAKFIDTGINYNVSKEYVDEDTDQLMDVRSFPEGDRNCYALPPGQGKNHKYLIRAWFMYGNYDSKNQPLVFKLYLGVDEWATVNITNASVIIRKEIIHIPTTDDIDVCLVNAGSGTPFISVLELQQLNDSIYSPTEPGSLLLHDRWDFGTQKEKWSLIRWGTKKTLPLFLFLKSDNFSGYQKCFFFSFLKNRKLFLETITNQTCFTSFFFSLILYVYWTNKLCKHKLWSYRSKDDVYDRIWRPFTQSSWESINSSVVRSSFSVSDYKLPGIVMATAATPANESEPLRISLDKDDDPSQKLYIYMHFAEVKEGVFREFTTFVNDDEAWGGTVLTTYLFSYTAESDYSMSGSTTKKLSFSLKRTNRSTLPPIINAMEVYIIKEFSQASTQQNDGRFSYFRYMF